MKVVPVSSMCSASASAIDRDFSLLLNLHSLLRGILVRPEIWERFRSVASISSRNLSNIALAFVDMGEGLRGNSRVFKDKNFLKKNEKSSCAPELVLI